MYKIYETAQACNVWLGPEDESSRLAMQYANTLDGDPFLHDYSHHLEFGGSSGYWESKAHVLDVLADHPDKQNLINACANFLLRRWFGRVWCSQEGAVSTNTNVYCGSDHVPWFNVFALTWLFLPRWTISWPGWFMEDYALLEPNLVQRCEHTEISPAHCKHRKWRFLRTYVTSHERPANLCLASAMLRSPR